MTLPVALVVLGALALTGWAMWLHDRRPREVAREVREAKEHAEAARIAAQEANTRTAAALTEALDTLSRKLTQAKDEIAAQGKKHRDEVDGIAKEVVTSINQLAAANALTRRDGQPFAGRPTLVPPDPTAAQGVIR